MTGGQDKGTQIKEYLRYGIGKGKCKQEVNVGKNVNVDNVHAVGAGRISALTGLSKVTWLAFVCLGR